MKRLFHILRIFVLILSLAVILMFAAAAIALNSGAVRGIVEREMSAALGAPVSIRGLRMNWWAGTLHLEGISLGENGQLGNFRSGFVGLEDYSSMRIAPEQIEFRGGALDLDQCLRLGKKPASAAPSAGPRTVALRDLEIMAQGQAVALLEVVLENTPGEPFAWRGWLAPRTGRTSEGSAGIHMEGKLRDDGSMALQLRCTQLGFDLSPSADYELHPWLMRMARLQPRGWLSLDARVDQAPSGALDCQAQFKLGSVSLLPPAPERQGSPADRQPTPFTAGTAEGVFGFRAPNWELARQTTDWEARASVRGLWRKSPWVGEVEHHWKNAGRRAWTARVACPELTLDRDLIRALGLERELTPTWDALEPRGAAIFSAHIQGPSLGQPLDGVDALLSVTMDGRAGMTYHGWVGPQGKSEGGFPLPVEGARGTVLILHDPTQAQPLTLALQDLQGIVGRDGKARCQGVVLPPRQAGGQGAVDLELTGSRIATDRAFLEALARLPGMQDTAPQVTTGAGEVDVSARLVGQPNQTSVSGRIQATLRGLAGSWSQFPLEWSNQAGQVIVNLDPQGAAGVTFAIRGRTSTSEKSVLRGRIQGGPKRPGATPNAAFDNLQVVNLELQNLSLRGSDRDVAGKIFPPVARALDLFGANGKVDLTMDMVQDGSPQRTLARLEIAPREVRLSPLAFPVESKAVRGRAILHRDAQQTESGIATRISPLIGDWSQGATTVALTAEFPAQGASHLRLSGAGIDVSNPNLVAALRASMAEGGTGFRGLDLSALKVKGRVDFGGTISLPEQGLGESVYRVFLRRNDFDAGTAMAGRAGFPLNEMRGILIQAGGVLEGADVRATLGDVPLSLRDARLASDGGGLRLETDVQASAFPLDPEHLSYFLDEKTIEALTGRLGLRGSLDIRRGHLALEPSSLGGLRTSFTGDIQARQTRISLGLPLHADSTLVDLKELVFEGNHVRAWAELSELEGSLGGRTLTDGRLQLTYVEPRLSLIDLDVRCERGRLRQRQSSGGESDFGGPAFAVDLVEPFPFELGLSLVRADVAGLLRGLFESEFASSGELWGELRLSGDLRQVTRIHGEGRLDLQNSILWSIPVVRDLFAQFGFDESAVFERIRTRFVVRNGEIRMPELDIYSPLIVLKGSGSMDFDGRLAHDFEVRYSLVDRLGPLTRMVYWIQRGLLSVSIRGDMARPQVVLKGMLSFIQRGRAKTRAIPLPALDPLPLRF